MPDFDTEAYLAHIFGEAELINQPPRVATGPAASFPRYKAQTEADLRFVAAPERQALRAGEAVARVIDLDASGLPELELPRVTWDWDLRWWRNGRLIMRDPSGRTRHFMIVSIARCLRTEALKTTADPATLSPPAEEAPAGPLTLEQVGKLTREQTKRRHEQARKRREPVLRSIRAAGKVPGTPDYPEDTFVNEVRVGCGLQGKEEVRGFHRTTLRRLFNSLND
jgi:hypothetical protein